MTRPSTIARRALAALLLAGCAVAAGAAGVRINQVADQAPDLAVFVSGLPAVPGAGPQGSAAAGTTAGTPAGSPAGAAAALGSTPLRVKSLAPWDPASGVSLVLALDVSASIARDFDAVKQAVGGLVGRLPPRSQVAVLAIGSDVRTAAGFGPPAAALASIAGLAADSQETALYEGILAGQQLAASAGPGRPLRRLVLVVTDALDDSRHGFGRDEALQKIAEGDAPVLALALAAAAPPPAQRDAIKALARIARASGGAFLQSTAGRAADNLQLLLADALRTQLLLLDCSACARDGAVRALQVSLQAPGGAATDSRSIRLLALQARPPPPPPSAAAAGSAAQAVASGASGPGVVPVRWFGFRPAWVAAVLVLLAVLLALLAWWRARQKAAAADKAPAVDPRLDDGAGGGGDGSVTGVATWTAASATTVAAAGAARAHDDQALTLDIDGQGRRELRVRGQDVVLGRSKAVEVPLAHDAEASTRHAAIYLAKRVLMVRDLGSSNGTWLNGTRIVKPEPLNDRDVLRIGRTEVRVYVPLAAAAAPRKAT